MIVITGDAGADEDQEVGMMMMLITVDAAEDGNDMKPGIHQASRPRASMARVRRPQEK